MRMKRWLIAATVLIVIGCALWGGVFGMTRQNIRTLFSGEFDTMEHAVSDAYENILLTTDTADITFQLAEDGVTRVVCREGEKVTHTVKVVDGVLRVELQDARRWYDHIRIAFGTPQITVFLPAGTYGDLAITSNTSDVTVPSAFAFSSVTVEGHTGKVSCTASVAGDLHVKTTTGNIAVEDASVGTLSLAVSTGKITLTNVTCEGDAAVVVSTGNAHVTALQCQNLTSTGNTGDLSMERVTVNGRMAITRSTGDIKMIRCDASEMAIRTGTGDVFGTLLSPKVFMAATDTGRVELPKTVTGGRCEIETSTGDITFEIVT